mgnify:CR=1 FL=1
MFIHRKRRRASIVYAQLSFARLTRRPAFLGVSSDGEEPLYCTRFPPLFPMSTAHDGHRLCRSTFEKTRFVTVCSRATLCKSRIGVPVHPTNPKRAYFIETLTRSKNQIHAGSFPEHCYDGNAGLWARNRGSVYATSGVDAQRSSKQSDQCSA